MHYKYLIAAALQEELNAFLRLVDHEPKYLGNGVEEIIIDKQGKRIRVLTFVSDKMGMPYNSAKLMEIILEYEPKAVIYIGTCAGLNPKYELGTVLIPIRAFSYESGKYEDGIFKPDYESYEFNKILRTQAESLNDKRLFTDFKIVTDENFCSGAAVIDDEKKIDEIEKVSSRKMAGIDMEAYAIACINQILISKDCHLIVVKSISDFGKNKGQTEVKGNKELAKINSAKFAYELIKYIDQKQLYKSESDYSSIIIYNGTNKNIVYDFKGRSEKLWDNQMNAFHGIAAKGSLNLQNSLITINRENVEGRYEVKLLVYNYNDASIEYIPEDVHVSGNRKMRITCEAKTDGAKHNLSFGFKEITTKKLTSKIIEVSSTSWIPIELHFGIDPNEKSFLRIDDQNVSKAPSIIYIRNIILYEEKNI